MPGPHSHPCLGISSPEGLEVAFRHQFLHMGRCDNRIVFDAQAFFHQLQPVAHILGLLAQGIEAADHKNLIGVFRDHRLCGIGEFQRHMLGAVSFHQHHICLLADSIKCLPRQSLDFLPLGNTRHGKALFPQRTDDRGGIIGQQGILLNIHIGGCGYENLLALGPVICG